MADDGLLADGTYDVIVVDADEVASGPGEPPAVSLDLTILAGEAKGEIVSVRAVGLPGDPILLLGVPGTLTVTDGVPSVQLEP